MHAMPHPGGRPPGPVAHQPAPPWPAPPQPPAAPQLGDLRRKAGRLDRRLIIANALCFAALVVLAAAAPGLLATEVIGRVNLGLLLCGAMGVLAFATSTGYDRRCARDCDPEADRIRARYEQETAAPPQPPAAPYGPGHRRTHR